MQEKNVHTTMYDFAVGGQALIEGVMMRSPHYVSLAFRHPQGQIVMEDKAFQSITTRYALLKLPLVRGVIHLWESMKIGFHSLNRAMEIQESEVDTKQDIVHSTGKIKQTWMLFLSVLSALFSLVLALVMMKLLPLLFAEAMSQVSPVFQEDGLVFNMMDGLAKLVIFFLYVLLIGQLKDIQRVFQYHGAEHKSIRCYEAHEALTVENAQKHSRFHPRCGTSFLFLVMLLSIFVYTLLPDVSSFWERLGLRLLVLPLIGGLSYELLKISASCSKAWWMKWIVAPGLLFQKWTTLEPDAHQLEVALASLQHALTLEKTYENS